MFQSELHGFLKILENSSTNYSLQSSLIEQSIKDRVDSLRLIDFKEVGDA